MSVQFTLDDSLQTAQHLPSISTFTFFTWVKAAAVDSVGNFFTTYDTLNDQYFRANIVSDSPNMKIRATFNNGVNYINDWSIADISAWFAFAIVLNGTALDMYTRAQGAGAWNHAGSSGQVNYGGTPAFFIVGGLGNETLPSTRRYTRIWDTALTEQELTDEFNSTSLVKTASINRHLALAAASSAATDSSSNGWNIETVNGTLADSALEPIIGSRAGKLNLLALGVG